MVRCFQSGPVPRPLLCWTNIAQLHGSAFRCVLQNALTSVVLGISLLLRRRPWPAVVLLTAVATTVRLEIALLVLPITLGLVAKREMSLTSALAAGMLGGFGSLGMAAPLTL